jgi:hypothetical protein
MKRCYSEGNERSPIDSGQDVAVGFLLSRCYRTTLSPLWSMCTSSCHWGMLSNDCHYQDLYQHSVQKTGGGRLKKMWRGAICGASFRGFSVLDPTHYTAAKYS